ncbi:TRAP transporter permease [Oceanispirochaeta crateris]|nr:TRAP transporter fused permease subunit [Oceanispirochaeta crateris]
MINQNEKLTLCVKSFFLVSTIIAVALYISYWFGFSVFGRILLTTDYSYLLYAALSPMIFLGIGHKGIQDKTGPRWYDFWLAAVFMCSFVYCFLSSDEISYGLWMSNPSNIQTIVAILLVLLSLEAGRRAAGWNYVAVILVCMAYSLFADRFSGPLYGVSIPFTRLILDFSFGEDGILGVPAVLIGRSMFGFYVFAATMQVLGGSDFFLKLANALFGRFRGGPAKTAVIASGLFGSLSGSITANVMTTGSITIPAMKKAGYSSEYAAAAEACASSGGDTMPPVMGGLAFIAVMVGNFEYSEIIVAAFLPTMLYYFGLLVQIDGYTARRKLKNNSDEESPGLLIIMKDGWPFMVAVAFLIFGLLYMKWGFITPLYTSGLVLVLSFLRRAGKPGKERLAQLLIIAGRQLSYGLAIFLGTGFILVSLYKTGMASALTAWIVSLGSDNILAVLILGALFNLFMGMLGLQRSSYLFLAVTMAPAVASIGHLPEIAVHLFLIFFAGLGGLTPPVAITAFIAAGIAGANGMKTAWTSMRLGFVLFIIPFFFVFQPALILQGTLWKILFFGSSVFVGVFFVASAIEGYILGYGELKRHERVLVSIIGVLIAFPQFVSILIGFVLGGIIFIRTRGKSHKKIV